MVDGSLPVVSATPEPLPIRRQAQPPDRLRVSCICLKRSRSTLCHVKLMKHYRLVRRGCISSAIGHRAWKQSNLPVNSRSSPINLTAQTDCSWPLIVIAFLKSFHTIAVLSDQLLYLRRRLSEGYWSQLPVAIKPFLLVSKQQRFCLCSNRVCSASCVCPSGGGFVAAEGRV